MRVPSRILPNGFCVISHGAQMGQQPFMEAPLASAQQESQVEELVEALDARTKASEAAAERKYLFIMSRAGKSY
jgi:hypothetical protein